METLWQDVRYGLRLLRKAPALQASLTNLADAMKSTGQAVLGSSAARRRLRDALAVAEIALFLALLEKTRRTPGVESAALSSEIPLEGGTNGYVQVPGNNNPALQNQLVEWNFITPDYFRVYGVSLLEGRNFTPEDLQQAAVTSAKLMALYKAAHGDLKTVPPDLVIPAVISQGMARTFWPHQDPLGKVFIGGAGEERVIGVVGDVKEWG